MPSEGNDQSTPPVLKYSFNQSQVWTEKQAQSLPKLWSTMIVRADGRRVGLLCTRIILCKLAEELGRTHCTETLGLDLRIPQHMPPNCASCGASIVAIRREPI